MNFQGVYDAINKYLPIVALSMLGIFGIGILVAIAFTAIKVVTGGREGVSAARKDIGNILIGSLIALIASGVTVTAQAALKAIKITPVTVSDAKAQEVVNKAAEIGNGILALLIALIIAGILIMTIIAAITFLGGDKAAEKGKGILMACVGGLIIVIVGAVAAKVISEYVISGFRPVKV